MFYETGMSATEVLKEFENHQKFLLETEASNMQDVLAFFEWSGNLTSIPKRNLK